MASADLCGKYKLVSSDNFEEFMKAMGVNIMMRKAGLLSKPVVEIKKDEDGTYTLKTVTTFKTSEIKFKLDEEFEETRMDGSTCKTVVTLEDGKLIQKQVGCDDKKNVTIIRELDGEQMKTTCSVDDITSVRVYNRCE